MFETKIIGKKMNKIHADIKKNRIYIIIRGNISPVESKEIAEKIMTEATNLESGFDVVSDTFDTIPATSEVRAEMIQIIKKLKDAGMSSLVRITPDAIISNQWQKTSRSISFLISEASNLMAADRILDGIEKSAEKFICYN